MSDGSPPYSDSSLDSCWPPAFSLASRRINFHWAGVTAETLRRDWRRVCRSASGRPAAAWAFRSGRETRRGNLWRKATWTRSHLGLSWVALSS